MTRIFFLTVLTLVYLTSKASCEAKATPRPVSTPASKKVATEAANLRLEMSEAQYRFKPSAKNLSDLVAALEGEVKSLCFITFKKALEASGSPSNPLCLERIDRLQKLHPNNPVAECAGHGLTSDSCRAAYQTQKVLIYDSGQDANKELLDPALRIGLNRAEIQRLELLYKTQKEVRDSLPNVPDEQLRRESIQTVRAALEEMLHIACRPVSERLIQKDGEGSNVEDAELKQVREKLLAIPQSLRSDYQSQMTRDYEEKMRQSLGNATEQKRILAILETIADPSAKIKSPVDSLERVRYVLPDCQRVIQETALFDRRLPGPVCYSVGFFTPQCADAVKQFSVAEERSKKQIKENPASVISTF